MKKKTFFIQGGAQDGKFLQRTKVKKPGMIHNGNRRKSKFVNK